MTTIAVRPQPVGLSPGAEGMLLIVEPGATAAHVGDDAVGSYNRFVLQPEAGLYHELRAAWTGPLADLLDVAAYAAGVIDEPPAETPSLDGELLALALATRAAWHLERGETPLAMARLKQAAVAAQEASPPFAAALWTELGMLHQDRAGGSRAMLTEAVKAYHEAVHCGYDEERQPEQYGLIQNNIGLAYLSMPMTEASDQLRMAVAVQSFREACRMFPRETHPEMWASTQMNLANALQYIPSSHPAENLAKAVEIYETLLAARNRDDDPVGYARVLANQGNALAHLGGLVVALAKLREARGLAMRAGATDLESSLTEQIDRIEAFRDGGASARADVDDGVAREAQP